MVCRFLILFEKYWEFTGTDWPFCLIVFYLRLKITVRLTAYAAAVFEGFSNCLTDPFVAWSLPFVSWEPSFITVGESSNRNQLIVVLPLSTPLYLCPSPSHILTWILTFFDKLKVTANTQCLPEFVTAETPASFIFNDPNKIILFRLLCLKV